MSIFAYGKNSIFVSRPTSYSHCMSEGLFSFHVYQSNWPTGTQSINLVKPCPMIILEMFGSYCPLRKHAHLNILKILPPKNEKFQIKNSDIFYISAQNIDCGYSLEPHRRGEAVLTSTHNLCFEQKYKKYRIFFLRRNKKNNVYLCKPQFYYIKVEFKGVKII